jgi:hypothetical protein
MAPHDRRTNRRNLAVELLEGRVYLSASATPPAHRPPAAVFARAAVQRIPAASPGEAAILSALSGGAGHEFVTLIRRQLSLSRILAVEAAFESGAMTEYHVVGAAFKDTNLQSGYTGLPHDPLSLTVAGGVLLKGGKIELAAIVRGPFTTYPRATYVVFAIDRGAGGRLGPAFASLPGITPDALVTVTVGPFGEGNSATITDLTTGLTTPLDFAHIQVKGPVVRLLVPASHVPSQGVPVARYRFAVWTRIALDGGIENVGSFVPENAMVTLGVENNVAAPRF